MLKPEPRSRIVAREALNHPWFKDNEDNAHNSLNDLAENMKDFTEQAHFDKGQITKEQLLTQTPLLGKR